MSCIAAGEDVNGARGHESLSAANGGRSPIPPIFPNAVIGKGQKVAFGKNWR